jgi:hypothetical protein
MRLGKSRLNVHTDRFSDSWARGNDNLMS